MNNYKRDTRGHRGHHPHHLSKILLCVLTLSRRSAHLPLFNDHFHVILAHRCSLHAFFSPFHAWLAVFVHQNSSPTHDFLLMPMPVIGVTVCPWGCSLPGLCKQWCKVRLQKPWTCCVWWGNKETVTISTFHTPENIFLTSWPAAMAAGAVAKYTIADCMLSER
jgi:hypothetical protein